MTFLIVGILVLALSFTVYTLIHFCAEAHLGAKGSGNCAMVTIHSSTSIPSAPVRGRRTSVVIGTRALLSARETTAPRSY
jgi:hypothetical protein